MNSLAIASAALGVATIAVHFIIGLNASGCTGGIAILLGIIALAQMRGGASRGRAIAVAGILLGMLPLLFVLLASLLLIPVG